MPHGLNDTFIVLIPKLKNPERLADLRPIALCNVIYKIMAKAVANRLKTILLMIISDSQSAFIQGRLITDNIVVAFEIGHFLKRKRQGRTGMATLKIDMLKAYDRLEWKFLEHMMHALGFADSWVNLIILCVATVEYKIIQERHEIGPIIPERGLRQGNPLSPYIFIICAEGLSVLLQDYEARGRIHGYKMARTALSISHLFFADDSFLFFKATMQESGKIKECIKLYEKASRQFINLQKSSISFSNNTFEKQKEEICHLLQVSRTMDHGTYLGLPLLIGKNKKDVFSFIKDKALQRIQGWRKKMFSKAGKEVFLKTIVQSIPTYVMSVFLLPSLLCSELEKMMNSFWWGMNGKAHGGIRWKS